MSAIIDYLFGAASFMPHGYCLLWRPDLVALHAVSDAVIAVSYFTIPIGLWYFARRRVDLEFRGLFYLFAAFILFCGLTHLLELITLWQPIYGLQGLVKAATAIISLASAYALLPVIPKALAIPGLSGMRQANQEMARLVVEREALVAERTAELTAANREVEGFALTIAHDLRSPLRSISAFSQVLVEEYGKALDTPGQEIVNRIHLATLRMSTHIDDLLLLSRIIHTSMHVTEVDLSSMATAIFSDLQRSEPDRVASIDVTKGILIHGDPGMMRVALAQLLKNAWKFTSDREQAAIAFGCRKWCGRDVFYVKDNGAGFDMAFATKLFQPFQRLHSPAEFPGNGMGLALVARIVARHGGRIKAKASLGKGTRIIFTLEGSDQRCLTE